MIYTLDVPAGPDRLLWYAMALFAVVVAVTLLTSPTWRNAEVLRLRTSRSR